MRAIFDTNIMIDFLRGIPEARQEVARFKKPMISVVTWVEVLVGVPPSQEAKVRAFLRRFEIVDLSGDIAERTIGIRREHRIKLPDAIIWATAQVEGALLVTRNTKDFPAGDPGVRVPYRH